MIESSKHVIRRALVSVSDKAGIVDFCRQLESLGIEIFSTGGTLRSLKDAGVAVHSVSDITGFPEILDGRVKTLHPAIHAGLLAELDKNEHLEQLKAHNIQSIDLLVVNLYPFEATLAKGAPHEEIVENIDIGGPTMLRSSAKNYKWTAVVTKSSRYDEIIEMLKANNCTLPEDYRQKLAEEVFEQTAFYDSVISAYFRKCNHTCNPEALTVPLKLAQKLRYGENPHQSAALYGGFLDIFHQLHGKELSYNNILDIDAAAKLILEFENESALAIVKHTNPCGVALGEDLVDAFNLAYQTDTVSAFGGIIVVTRTIDKAVAETIHSLFTELIIAPEFTPEAFEVLTKKRDRRLITVNFATLRASLSYDLKSVAGYSYLRQDTDLSLLGNSKMSVVTVRQPTDDEMRSLMFGWKVAKHVKSNSIIYSNSRRALGIGAGQMSRVDSSRIAVEKAKLMGIDLQGSTMASDAYFPFADGVEEAMKAGATAVIQPGGSVRDQDVIDAANKFNMAMVFTGQRHFRH